ncbi:MAG: hypothetical protein IKO55_13655 [Kiritimatiellae bacterium]|nr:hypothetical protein [Kiritimatiellia bacterium]
MPGQVNANYGANFQKFVDFVSKAYATKGENTVARFEGTPTRSTPLKFLTTFWLPSGFDILCSVP